MVRFAEAARELALPTVFGAELTLNAAEARSGRGRPRRAAHLLVPARDTVGYAGWQPCCPEAQMAGEKGRPSCRSPRWPRPHRVGPAAAGRCSPVAARAPCPQRWSTVGPAAAERELRSLVAAFGAEHTFVELWDHGDPLDSARNDALARLSATAGLQAVATNNVHYAAPSDRMLATAMAAIRSRRSLDEIDGWLPGGGTAHLRSGAEQARRFERYPGVVAAAATLGRTARSTCRWSHPSCRPTRARRGPTAPR